MTNDKELVEVWRKQFESNLKSECHLSHLDLKRSPLGKYLWMGTEALWNGFLLAKRTQPSVVPPKEYNTKTAFYEREIYTKAEGWDECIEEFKSRLTAAGIKYTIGE